MNLRRTPTGQGRRRGVILLIVLVMLTLFAIAGLTFVLYASATSESARFYRDSESYATSGGPDYDPNAAFAFFLGQFIYGTTDPSSTDNTGTYSALRGHSLAETMYGSYDANGTIPSDAPYDGTGRLHEPNLFASTDGYQMVNYTYFQTDGILRDPSRIGSRTGAPPLYNSARGPYTGGQNAPYTYPDLNSMFLASINSSTGQVTLPSYYRSWTGIGNLNPSTNAAANPNWYSNSTPALNVLKYMTLRPRPADMGPGFPPPASPTGDVTNLIGVSTQPDSIWIDIGAPVLNTAAGLRYKMLVAPLILDLDNRVNLNVAGNVLANGGLHASNQGWGPWEVNMSKVLSAGGNESQNILLGNPPTGAATITGRYGADRLPSAVFPGGGSAAHVYAPTDLDGLINLPAPGGSVTGTGTGPYTLPGPAGGYFPSFDPNAYLNGTLPEHTNSGGQFNHPMYFNPFFPVGDDRLLPLPAYASLLWAGVNASPGSDLVRLCPNNFTPTNPAAINRTTVLSMDLDRAGAAPYIYNPTTVAYTVAYNVTAPGQGTYANSGVTTPPTFPTISPPPRQGPPAAQGEFDPNTWRSVLADTLTRMNLNRALTPYTGANGNPAQAATDRQTFAMDIFKRLVNVTGMAATYNNGNPAAANPPATPQQYATLRWLAQLSANIVDFIDTDDVMTAFQWAATPQAPDTGYVFGTELPKLVVNEVYLEYDNDSADPNMIPNPNPPPPMMKAATKQYHMNVWAELLNPLPSGNDLNGPNNANLVDANNNPLYQLVITSPNKGLRNAANLAGDPDGANPPNPPFAVQPYTPTGSYTSAAATGGQVLAVVNNWGGVQNVTPVGTATSSNAAANSNTGFLVVGPPNPPLAQGQVAGTQTQITTSVTANNMTYTVPNGDASANAPVPPTILLQRLANPNVPFNATPGAGYNPYVTVDYVDMQQVGTATGKTVVNDARQYNAQGTNANFISSPNNRYSFGRNQPYGAEATAAEWQQQVAPANPPLTANQPTTTFFSVNTATNPAVAPYWLVHLDRPLISPIELLNVSGFKPHELTQQFYKDANGNFQHVAPWTQPNFLLYRLLEFVKVKSSMPGIAKGGRVPGKININTIDATTGGPVFQALADAEPGNSFTATDVQNAFTTLMQTRTPGGTPGPNDQPFWGMAQGPAAGGDAQSTGQRGMAQTLLNGTLTNTNAGATHPYQKMELLNKLFGNVTTRSNVFAVWLTVGFFQVVDDTVQPVKLGPEVNLAQGKNIRHHMFAIVDRTQIQTFATATTAAITGPTAPATQVAANISIPNPVPDARTGRSWAVQPGSILVYEPGSANEETVTVLPNGTTANFTLSHASGAAVVSRGNPGPWKLPPPSNLPYDPAQDTQVVPYVVIID